jgi:hypothetical protein
VEGPLLPVLTSGLAEDRPEFFEAALRAARLAEDHRELLFASGHILAVAVRAAHDAPDGIRPDRAP